MNTAQDFEYKTNLIEELKDFLKESWRTLLISMSFGMIIGVAAAFLLPEKFEATAAVESGKVLGQPIEEVDVLLARMKLPSYYSESTVFSCGGDDIANQVSPRAGRSAAFILISYRAATSELAKQCLEAVLSDVRKNQAIESQPSIKIARENISSAKEKLERAEKFIADLRRAGVNSKGAQIGVAPFLFLIYQAKQDEIQTLRKEISALTMDLTEPRTRPAAFAAPVYSPSKKVEPKRVVITVIFTVLAGFLGVLFMFFRRTYRNNMMRSECKPI